MLVAMLGPNLALRGPDESLHDAVSGMHRWNTVILALFMTSLGLLQLCVFSFMYFCRRALFLGRSARWADGLLGARVRYGHSQLGYWQRTFLMATIGCSALSCVHYARIIVRKMRLPRGAAVTGEFFGADGERLADEVADDGLSSRRPVAAGVDATRIAGDERAAFSAEALEAALAEAAHGPEWEWERRSARGAARSAAGGAAGESDGESESDGSHASGGGGGGGLAAAKQAWRLVRTLVAPAAGGPDGPGGRGRYEGFGGGLPPAALGERRRLSARGEEMAQLLPDG